MQLPSNQTELEFYIKKRPNYFGELIKQKSEYSIIKNNNSIRP